MSAEYDPSPTRVRLEPRCQTRPLNKRLAALTRDEGDEILLLDCESQGSDDLVLLIKARVVELQDLHELAARENPLGRRINNRDARNVNLEAFHEGDLFDCK